MGEQQTHKTQLKLAIVIPCYNYATFVTHAIQSVTQQMREECELVVVDDGSTDASWEAIQKTGVNAFRKENGGALAACIYGFDKTTAPFVLFLDADDELRPGAIEHILSLLDDNVSKLQLSMPRIDADGNVISEVNPLLSDFRVRESLQDQVLKTGVYVSPPTSGNVFRRDICEFLKEIDYDNCVDGAILFAAPFWGDVVSSSKPVVNYRIHSNNMSGLGRQLDPSIFQRDMDRYIGRMDHLRKLIKRSGSKAHLVDPRKTFYYRELKICHDVMTGKRPPLKDGLGVISSVSNKYFPIKQRVFFSLFHCLLTLAPNSVARNLVNYRFVSGGRSLGGFLKLVVGSLSQNKRKPQVTN